MASQSSTRLFCVLLCTAAHTLLAAAAAPVTVIKTPPISTANNVLEWISTQNSTRIHAALLARYPYMQQVLAHPKWVGTVFVPNDAAWLKPAEGGVVMPEGKTVPQMLASLAALMQTEPSTVMREEDAYQFLWVLLCNHIIVGKALNQDSFRDKSTLWPVLADPSYDSYKLKVSRSITKDSVLNITVWARFDPGAGRILRSVKAGAAWIHVIDGKFQPTASPPSTYTSLQDWLWEGDVLPIFNASDYWPIINGPWDTPLVPTVTVLTPSPTAIAPFLASRNTTLPAFLQNKAAVNAFVAAHIVPGRRLWRPDFMNLALLRGSNELSVNGTYASFGQEVLQMMGGGTFGVRTNLQDVWLVPSGDEGMRIYIGTTEPAGNLFGRMPGYEFSSVVLGVSDVLPH